MLVQDKLSLISFYQKIYDDLCHFVQKICVELVRNTGGVINFSFIYYNFINGGWRIFSNWKKRFNHLLRLSWIGFVFTKYLIEVCFFCDIFNFV